MTAVGITFDNTLSFVSRVFKGSRISLRTEDAYSPWLTRSGVIRRYAGAVIGSAAQCQPDVEWVH